MINPLFWQGKTVLITGHTGFKGSWLALWLQQLNANVIGFALPAKTSPNLFYLANVAHRMTNIEGDICDYALLHEVIEKYKPEIIIHMAAQSLVRYSYQQPVETYATNLMGTLHLLEAARHQQNHIRVIINVTSDKCYENKDQGCDFKESDPLGGHDPYSSSKACAELVTAAYRDSYFKLSQTLGVATVRAGNVIGGGDWADDRLIPDFVRACLQQQKCVIRYPDAIRPWQHVLDPLYGYLVLAEKLYIEPNRYAEAWNFGPNEAGAKPVKWITEYLAALWGDNSPSIIMTAQKSPHEAQYLKLDCSKTQAKLKWKPHWPLEKALAETVNWYKKYQLGHDLQAVSLAQIADYQSNVIGSTIKESHANS